MLSLTIFIFLVLIISLFFHSDVWKDLSCELIDGVVSSNVSSSDFALLECLENWILNDIWEEWQLQVSQHHDWAQNEGSRVSTSRLNKIKSRMSGTLLEQSMVKSNVATWSNSCTSNKPSSYASNDWAIKIWQKHHIKRLRMEREIHACSIHNHLFILDLREILSNLSRCIQELSINQFHDVCLMNNCDLLSIGCQCILKGILSNSLTLLLGDDLHRLNHTWVDLMLNRRVLALASLSDRHDVNVLVSCLYAWDTERMDSISKEIKLLRDVQGLFMPDVLFMSSGSF